MKEKLSLSGNKLVELVRVVLEKGAVFRLTARGYSMSPAIMDGDVISISPFRGVRPHVGEVVAFTLPEKKRLIVHRVTEIKNGKYLIKGDNNPDYDGLIPEPCLLGVVTKVERDGKALLWPDRFRRSLLARIYFREYPILRRLSGPLWFRLNLMAVYIIQSRLYRFISRRLFTVFVRQVEIRVKDSSETGGPAKADAGDFVIVDKAAQMEKRGTGQLEIVASVRDKPVGYMTFFPSPTDCPFQGWWAGDGVVRVPFKSCGIEERMFARAEEELATRDVPSILINLPESSPLSASWCRAVGLKHKPPETYGDMSCAVGRIIMEKRIDGKGLEAIKSLDRDPSRCGCSQQKCVDMQ